MQRIWSSWKKIVEKIADFQASLLFSFLYFFIFTPLGLITNIYYDFLNLKKFPEWQKHPIKINNIKSMKNQF
jgi:hypothetical protein